MKTEGPPKVWLRRNGGFALLLVLGLILCLAVWTGALGVVAERGAAESPEVEASVRARAAALVALERARERVQRLAGPDPRVTAGAGRLGGIDDGRRGVAGVWDVAGENVTFLGWLADGAEEDVATLAWPAGLPASADAGSPDAVALLGAGSVAAAPDRFVMRLRRQPEQPNLPGAEMTGSQREVRVAYAVFDEGVKASVLTVAAPPLRPAAVTWPELSEASWDAARRWERAVSPAHSGWERLFPGLDGASPELLSRSQRIFARSQLRLLDRAVTPVRLCDRFHDVTPLSRALLVSTSGAAPGWRRNWSDPERVDDPVLADRLRLSVVAGGTLPVQPTRTIERGPLAGGMDWLGPSVVEASWWVAARVSAAATGPAELGLRHEMRIALWNAGAVTRTLEPGELEVVWEGLPGLHVAAASGLPVVETLAPPTARIRAVNRLGVVWAPGEVILLRGGRDLASDGGPDLETWPLPTGPDDSEPRWHLRWEAVPAASLSVVLRVRGEWLGTWRSRDGLRAVERTLGPSQEAGLEGWDAAYGIGMDAAGADARVPLAHGAPLRSGARWSDDPVANTDSAAAFTAEELPPSARGVRWDVPVARGGSLLGLRAIVNERGEGVGARGAGAFNRVFDDVCFLPTAAAGGLARPPDETPPPAFLERRAPLRGTDPGSSDIEADAWWVRGAFNVNATSVAAWSALLRGALDVAGLAGAAGLRTPRQGGEAVPRDAELSNRAAALAEALVARSRLRQRPFRSVAEFVNSGILEDALADVGLNDGLPAEHRGTPGWIDQGDLFCRLGPRLVARSDTFLVRVYADVCDTRTGKVIARAWAEATLQRVAEPAGATRTPPSEPPSGLRPGAEARRIALTDFRWLLPSDG